MASLAESNPYLRDPKTRRRILEKNARASCAFEGARGLKSPSLQAEDVPPRSMASRKKSDKAS